MLNIRDYVLRYSLSAFAEAAKSYLSAATSFGGLVLKKKKKKKEKSQTLSLCF